MVGLREKEIKGDKEEKWKMVGDNPPGDKYPRVDASLSRLTIDCEKRRA
jgi:hypothetical protein